MKSKNIVIRSIDRFSEKELLALETLDSASCWEYDEYLEMKMSIGFRVIDFKNLFVEQKCRGFAILDGETLRGYLIYETQESLFRIRRIMVCTKHRLKGFGSTILDYLFEVAQLSDKRKEIVASVSEKFMEACAFLSKQGFSVKLEKSRVDSDTLHFTHVVESIVA